MFAIATRCARGGDLKTSRHLTTGPTLSDQAYHALREMITSGALISGQRVTERSLAVQLNWNLRHVVKSAIFVPPNDNFSCEESAWRSFRSKPFRRARS